MPLVVSLDTCRHTARKWSRICVARSWLEAHPTPSPPSARTHGPWRVSDLPILFSATTPSKMAKSGKKAKSGKAKGFSTKKAGLKFSPGAIGGNLKRGRFAKRVSKAAAVYLASAIEYSVWSVPSTAHLRGRTHSCDRGSGAHACSSPTDPHTVLHVRAA